MKLLAAILTSLVLSSVVEAIDASVQYRPGEGKADYRRYRPTSPVSGQSSADSRQGDKFRSLIEKTVKAKDAVYDSAWSGTRKDLEAVVKKAEQNFGFENTKHLGRNATMLVPATLDEMRKEIALFGNPNKWEHSDADGAHGNNADSDDRDITWGWKSLFPNGVDKYIVPYGDGDNPNEHRGREVVYDSTTGKIITNVKMGTWNFDSRNGVWSATFGSHNQKDMATNKTKANPQNQFEKDGDQYKYVGILYERDPNDPDKYYIIDGQTGLPMTPQKVAEMPTTLSDMWKDMGLACVANDAEDIIPAKEKSAEKSEKKDEQEDNTDVSQISIDTSKLESLLKEQIAFVKSLLAKGERATEGEIETFNSRQKMMRQEIRRVFDEIKAISATDEEKKRIVETELATAIKLVDQLHKLCNETVSKKIIAELKSISFDELENSETGQAGNKGDECLCPNPDYKAIIPPAAPGWATCTKCGKLLGVIVNGRFISTNPAVNGKPVK